MQNGRCKKYKIKIKLNSDEYLSFQDYYVYKCFSLYYTYRCIDIIFTTLFDSDVNAEMLSHTENKTVNPFSVYICLHNIIIILWQG